MPPGPDMSIDLAGLRLRSPLIAAAGTCGYVTDLPGVASVEALGAIVTKSITRESREGNAPWRMVDLPAGMLNAIGLANVGLERFLAEKLPAAGSAGVPIIGSVAGASIDDYVHVTGAFDEAEAIAAIELNVSCPNTDDGLEFGTDPARLRTLIEAVRPAARRVPLIVKLSPNVGDVTACAGAAIDAGADALTLINTVAAMAIDVRTRRPRLSRGAGGLSGPAVHPIAVRMVHAVHRAVAGPAGVPIIGLGGVTRWEDAAELVLAGATGVGIGTGLLVDLGAPRRVRRGLERWVGRQGAARISELTGAVEPPAGVAR